MPESNNIDNKMCVDIHIIHVQCALFTLYFAATLRIVWGSQFWLFGTCNCTCDATLKSSTCCIEFTMKPNAAVLYSLLSSVLGGKRKFDTYNFWVNFNSIIIFCSI